MQKETVETLEGLLVSCSGQKLTPVSTEDT